MEYLGVGCASLIGWVFLTSAISKLRHFGGFALAGALLAAFTAAIGTALKRGRRVPCRCFGVSSTPLGPGHLVRNAILLISTLAGGLALDAQPPQAAGLVIAIAVGLVGAILIVAVDDIAFLFARTS